MAKRKVEMLEVTCPCCQAELHIDPETKAVIRYVEHKPPPSIADLEAAVERQKGEQSRREEAFRKSLQSHQEHGKVLDKKFEELLKQAKESPDEPPPKRDIDFD